MMKRGMIRKTENLKKKIGKKLEIKERKNIGVFKS